ncbi:hypothetical protein C8Q75DRAFT_283498 [Abortiporus biennis]|nr:hypothetical protein C8Q75DRAFT_283498 [Abortiporus biennis]
MAQKFTNYMANLMHFSSESSSESSKPTNGRIVTPLPGDINHILPAELILQIFHHYRDLFNVPPGNPIPKLTKVYTWIPALTHVCHHWRYLALSSPSLWNVVTAKRFANMDCIKAMIHRSATHPLIVTLDPAGMSVELIRLLLQEMHRIQELFISSTLQYLLSKQIRPLLALPAPLLRTLLLATEPSYGDVGLGVGIFDRPDAPFHVNLPKLQLVVLNNPIDSFLLSLARPSVREFHYTLQGRQQRTSIGLHRTILSALRLMPQLNKLFIHIDIPPFSDRPLSDMRIPEDFTLGQLREIQLDAPIHSCTILLQHIQTSPLVRLNIKCAPIDSGLLRTLILAMNNKFYDGVNLIPASTSPSSTTITSNNRQISSLVFGFNEFGLVTQGYDSGVEMMHHHGAPTWTKPKPTFELFLSIYHMTFDHYFPVQLNTFQLSSIHTILFRSTTYFHEVFTLIPRLISITLREIPLLRHLGIEGYPSKNVMELFSISTSQQVFESPLGQDYHSEASDIFLPNLESLTFMTCSLHWSDDVELFARFIEGLRMRKRMNKGLPKLVLVGCYNFGRVQLETLSAIVPDILVT